MNKRKIYFLGVFLILICTAWMQTDSVKATPDFSERVKIALRDVGNELLLNNQDSISLVAPVLELQKNKYQLSFERPLAYERSLSFEPHYLVGLIKNSFAKMDLPEHYRVEVNQCVEKEVAYSYEVSTEKETTIVPCGGRVLPENCYIIEVKFTKMKASVFGAQTYVYILLVAAFLLLAILYFRRKQNGTLHGIDANFEALGSFKFYPEQNKLVKEATEISLSKKECELLAIFIDRPNQIIKRDELTKRVWEDNGVVVGRSLDTYISKLRKKLKEDQSIKLTNVHGVGYKLEVNS
ncbi:MAG: winged helix-turn-helix domain-containing protein [Bacteroidota bacterium]